MKDNLHGCVKNWHQERFLYACSWQNKTKTCKWQKNHWQEKKLYMQWCMQMKKNQNSCSLLPLTPCPPKKNKKRGREKKNKQRKRRGGLRRRRTVCVQLAEKCRQENLHRLIADKWLLREQQKPSQACWQKKNWQKRSLCWSWLHRWLGNNVSGLNVKSHWSMTLMNNEEETMLCMCTQEYQWKLWTCTLVIALMARVGRCPSWAREVRDDSPLFRVLLVT